MKKKKIKQTVADRIFNLFIIFVAIIVLCIFAYPLWFVLIASISDPSRVWAGDVIFLPKNITWAGYLNVFKESNVWIGYRNSLFYTLVGVLISLILTVCAAYPLSRKDFKPRNFIMALYTFTMFFSGGIIPLYLVIKSLHMLDSIWAVLLPTSISAYNMIVTRTYFASNIPEELREAALIDGCSNTKFIIKVVLPLSKSILAVMALYYGSARWGEFFNPLMFLSSRDKLPLQVFLREYLVQQADGMSGQDMFEIIKLKESLKYSLIIIASIPMLLLYPFIQKYFVKGVMIGAVKG